MEVILSFKFLTADGSTSLTTGSSYLWGVFGCKSVADASYCSYELGIFGGWLYFTAQG